MKIERELTIQEIKTLDKRVRDIVKGKSRLIRFVMSWTITCIVVGTIISLFVDNEILIWLFLTVLILYCDRALEFL